MLIQRRHPWDLSPREASSLQHKLRPLVSTEDAPELSAVKNVAGADISYSRRTNHIYAVVHVFSYPELELIEIQEACHGAVFPYIPGLLAFREGPALVDAFERTLRAPDLIILDGHGLAHPRGLGLASHMGLLLEKPTVGCAKSRLIGECAEPAEEGGALTSLTHKGEPIGAVLRTKSRIAPVFVSVGHKISLGSAVRFVLNCCRGYRLPEPSRRAHIGANYLRKNHEAEVATKR